MYVITDKEAQGRHLDGPCGQSPTPLTSTLSVPQKKNTKMKKKNTHTPLNRRYSPEQTIALFLD